jgi:hypothetical protein
VNPFIYRCIFLFTLYIYIYIYIYIWERRDREAMEGSVERRRGATFWGREEWRGLSVGGLSIFRYLKARRGSQTGSGIV